jgi:hypothetical protein
MRCMFKVVPSAARGCCQAPHKAGRAEIGFYDRYNCWIAMILLISWKKGSRGEPRGFFAWAYGIHAFLFLFLFPIT